MKQIDILRKRLYYQSHHRGLKEMDLVLGAFAQQYLETMSEGELIHFEDLLAFPDQNLYGWFFEGAPLPQDAPKVLVEMINDHIRA